MDDGEDYNEPLINEPLIVYCPMHARAPAMLAALAEAIELIEGFYERDSYRRSEATREMRDTVFKARAILRTIGVGDAASRCLDPDDSGHRRHGLGHG